MEAMEGVLRETKLTPDQKRALMQIVDEKTRLGNWVPSDGFKLVAEHGKYNKLAADHSDHLDKLLQKLTARRTPAGYNDEL